MILSQMMIRAAVRVWDPGWFDSRRNTPSSRRVFIMTSRGDDNANDKRSINDNDAEAKP